jgi:serine/threonine protein phosphatase 1
MVFSRWFRRATADTPSPATTEGTPVRFTPAPPDTRLYAIGDVHGRADLLERLHALILADAAHSAASRKVIIYLGDYVDRGPKSRQVIEALLHPAPDGFERVFLRGNHEHAMLQFLNAVPGSEAWLSWGGESTLFSYGVRPRGEGGKLRDMPLLSEELNRALPPEHRAFLSALPLYHEEGNYLFVHAGIRPDRPMEAQTPEDLMFIRDEFIHHGGEFTHTVVFGHSIFDAPFRAPHRIGIDTGAYATGKLTALWLEGSDGGFLHT